MICDKKIELKKKKLGTTTFIWDNILLTEGSESLTIV